MKIDVLDMTDSIGQFDSPTTATESANRVLGRCDELAQCSESPTHLTRTFLSQAMDDAHEMVAGWMREAGLTPHIDEMGNLIGHSPAANGATNAPMLLLGSHLDTVPNAGKYDGVLGVLLAIEVASLLKSEELPFSLEVIGFSEEEGVRYATPYLGSRAIAGSFNPEVLDLLDQSGISMRQALRQFGLSPDGWGHAKYDGEHVVGYLEAHIEQGPFLESVGAPLGVVTAIAGQSRLRLLFLGYAGHAGTSPMHLRRDALGAASEWVLAVEELAGKETDLVATVGSLEVVPNTANVVPGEARCSLDVRHAHDAVREGAVEKLLNRARAIATKRGVSFEVLAHQEQPAVPMDLEMQQRLMTACHSLQIEAPEIVSGAGHDAAIMASLAPTGMLFLRTPGGASHSPAEAVNAEDVALALQAMHAFVVGMAQ